MLARDHEIVRYMQVAQAPGSCLDHRAAADVKTVQVESLVASIVSEPPPLTECTALLEELQGALVSLTNSKADLMDQLDTAQRKLSTYSDVQAEISAREESSKVSTTELTIFS